MKMQFLQYPVVQKVTFILSILFLVTVILFPLLFLLGSRESYDRFTFYNDPDTGYIYKFDKQTGKVYWIAADWISECGTVPLAWTKERREAFNKIAAFKFLK